jgi:hypothetical protein
VPAAGVLPVVGADEVPVSPVPVVPVPLAVEGLPAGSVAAPDPEPVLPPDVEPPVAGELDAVCTPELEPVPAPELPVAGADAPPAPAPELDGGGQAALTQAVNVTPGGALLTKAVNWASVACGTK